MLSTIVNIDVLKLVSQPNLPQTSTSGTQTHRQHTATYQIKNLTTQTSREVVTALSTENGPLNKSDRNMLGF
jgi:hypothetical protein